MKRLLLVVWCAYAATALFAQGGAPLRSAGTEFWLAFPTNDPYNPLPANLSLFITADSAARVTTTMTARTTYREPVGNSWGFVPPHDTVITRTDSVYAAGTLVIPVDTINNLSRSGAAQPYAIHVLSSAPVRVFSLSHKLFTSDGVTAFPVAMCDTSYVLAAQQNDAAGYTTYASEAAFIATQDSTRITIFQSCPLSPPQVNPFSIVLMRGQAYQIKADTTDKNADLTGTLVSSNKPVVAIAGVERTWIRGMGSGQPSRDYAIEQMLPVKYLGKSYLAAQTAQDYSPNRIRAVAAFDSTLVVVNDTTYTLQRQQYIDVGVTGARALYASKPVCAVEDEPSSNSGIGDPFMTLLPPVRDYDSSYAIYVPTVEDTAYVTDYVIFNDTTYWRDTTVSKFNGRARDTIQIRDSLALGGETADSIVTYYYDTTYQADSVHVHDMTHVKVFDLSEPVYFDNYLTAAVRNEDIPFFTIDGLPVNTKLFTATPYCDYAVITKNLNPGAHTVRAPHGFWLMYYGYGYTDSYGYVAGMKIAPDDSIVAGTLAFGRVRVQTTKDSAALIRNAGGRSVVITGASIVGQDAKYFTLIADSLPATLAAGDSLAFTLGFTPDAVRNFSAFLQLCTDENIVLIPLSGTGVAARLVFIPQTTNWGLRIAFGRYDSTVVLRNIGNDSANVTGETVARNDTGVFSIASQSFELQAGDQRTLRVNFHPPATGAFSDTVTAVSDAPGSPATAQLLGSATGVTIVVDSVDFGTRLLGSPADSVAFIADVSDNIIVKLDTLELQGPDAAEFSIVSPPPFPKFLAPGETLWVAVHFAASAAGAQGAFIAAQASAPAAPILLTGFVKDIVAPALGGLSLPPLCAGAAFDTSVQFANHGTSPLTITAIQSSDASFAAILNEPAFPLRISPDSSLEISLHVSPQPGADTAVISVTYVHAADTARTMTARIVSFGLRDSVAASQTAATDLVPIGNTRNYCIPFFNRGNEPVTIDTVTFGDAAHFTLFASLPIAVPAGDSTCIPFTFSPAAADTARTAIAIVYYAQCASGTLATSASAIGAAPEPVIQSLDFAPTYTCTQRDGSITIANASPVDGEITAITLADTTAPFTLDLPAMPAAFPARAVVTIPVHFAPQSSGTYATDLIVVCAPRDTTEPPPQAVLRGSAQQFALAAAIAAAAAPPGAGVTLNVTIGAGVQQLQLHSVRGTIGYNPHVLFMSGYSTAGTAIAGFTLDTFAIDNPSGVILFHAHDATGVIQDNPLLLQLHALALAGDTNATALPLDIEFPDDNAACVAVTNDPGGVVIDTMCGKHNVTNASVSLGQNSPNPCSSVSKIRFEINAPEHVRIALFNLLGETVSTLADGDFAPGAHTVAVHAGALQAGVYYYRMTAGSSIKTMAMTVVK